MIYLDHNATSPMLPEVKAAMESWWGVPANPASIHRAGQGAYAAVERAREQVAELVGGNASGVIFTSGATEANHTFLRALPLLDPRRGLHVNRIEHPSVLAAASWLHKQHGYTLLWGSVDEWGRVHQAVHSDAAAVTIQAANHETGAVQSAPSASGQVLTHVDATQAAGRLRLTLGDVDGVTLSAHKLGGPPGIGALILKTGDAFPPLLSGGGQERGRRAGTVPTALAVGFGVACELAAARLDERRASWLPLREQLDAALQAAGGRVAGLGSPHQRLPQTSCAVFEGVVGETLVQALDLRGFCVSAGAACASGSLSPSPVLRAMGLEPADGAIRVSLGPASTEAEVSAFCTVLAQVVPAVTSR